MQETNTIRVEHAKQLIELIVGFVKEGLTFTVDKDAQCYWIIKLTGGY